MENENIKTTYVKNLDKINFTSLINIPININADIKNVLDVETYIFDDKIECGSGKANYSGKIGVKVLYLDTDNLTNSIFDSGSFTETILDSGISAESFINTTDTQLVNSVSFSNGMLKVTCEVSLSPVLYFNLALPNLNAMFENLIVKKQEIHTNGISKLINTNFEHTINLETKENVNKILVCNTKIEIKKVESFEEYALVEGKFYTKLIFENNSDTPCLKQIFDVSEFKTEVNIPGLNKNDILNLSFEICKDKENISTENEEDLTLINVTNSVKVSGVAFKDLSVEVVDDLYSTENELNVNLTTREYCEQVNCENLCESLAGEITLSENEPLIDEIVCVLNSCTELTNRYVKNNELFLEGIISSNLIYLDENKNLQSKKTELPFVLNTKIKRENLNSNCLNVKACEVKSKSKRGNVVEMEYVLMICFTDFSKNDVQLVDSFTLGKPLDFSKYDYQIFVAKPEETLWDLCKRIKIDLNDISKYNANLPPVLKGGERVIVKR